MISLASASTSASTSAADLRPLDEDDFRRFDALLDATGNEDAMVVEEIDGFLAALACVPDPIGENELLAQVLGTESFGDDSSGGGASGSEPREAHVGIATLLRRHAAQVVAALDAAEFAPVLSHDEDGNADGVAWAVGFLRGVELHPDSWETLLAEKDFDDVLDAMESLTAELDEDAGGDEDAPSAPGSQAERDGLIDRMIGDIADIHEFFRPWREAGTTPAAMRVETVRRAGPKTGRNEPCPCGSGRKYKSCCGAG